MFSGCDLDLAGPFKLAIDGDGAALASLIEGCRLPDAIELSALLAVLPRVKTHREELAARVRALDHRALAIGLNRMFEFVTERMMRRDLLRLAGDEALAAHTQQILDRYLAAFGDRDKAVALIMWDEE